MLGLGSARKEKWVQTCLWQIGGCHRCCIAEEYCYLGISYLGIRACDYFSTELKPFLYMLYYK